MAPVPPPFPQRSLLLRFGLYAAAGAAAVSVALVVLLDSFQRQRIAVIEVQATSAVREASRDLQRLFFEVVGDVGIISRLPAVRTAVDQPSEAHWRAVAQQLEGFVVEYGRYPRIQILDRSGAPVASYPMEAGKPSAAAAAITSSVAALLVQQRQLVALPLIWQGTQAVLPVARPLRDREGHARFELWVDLQLNRTFEGIALILQVPELKAEAWILDAEGRVISAPPPRGSRQQASSLLQQFPMLRKPLEAHTSGRLLGPEGLFVYQAINPLQQGTTAPLGSDLGEGGLSARLNWMLVMRIPPDQLQRGSLVASPQGRLLIGGLYGAMAAACALLAYSQWLAQQRQQEADRHADELWRLSSTDALTGLVNRRRFEEVATYEIARCHRTGAPLALLLLDLDHFKAINDGYGHGTGDLVLRAFAEAAQSALREIDTIARWGGEEFAVLMPDTAQQPAVAVAERVRRTAEGLTVMPRSSPIDATIPLSITVSIGVVAMEACALSLEAMLQLADQGLYAAKGAGRNCVAVLQAPGQKPSVVRA
jgi:diguanylate cyclase (GGDEF)-like protein